MNRLQERLARIGLEVLGGRGFVLGGGHAVELHGMASRPSEDIDLFSAVRDSPGEAAADLIAAYQSGGFGVAVLRETADLVAGLPRHQLDSGQRPLYPPAATTTFFAAAHASVVKS
jgi:hypothetical protein